MVGERFENIYTLYVCKVFIVFKSTQRIDSKLLTSSGIYLYFYVLYVCI
jgi:hypothetical protein